MKFKFFSLLFNENKVRHLFLFLINFSSTFFGIFVSFFSSAPHAFEGSAENQVKEENFWHMWGERERLVLEVIPYKVVNKIVYIFFLFLFLCWHTKWRGKVINQNHKVCFVAAEEEEDDWNEGSSVASVLLPLLLCAYANTDCNIRHW